MSIHFVQLAETERSRISLGGIDLTYHQYPYDLLFRGAYEDVPSLKMQFRAFMRVFRSNAKLVVLPCYDKVEYWWMLVAAILRGKRRAVFCDSTALDRKQTWVKSFLKWTFFKCCHGFFAYGKRSGEYLKIHGVQTHRIFTRCQSAALPHNYSPELAIKNRLRQFPSSESPRLLYVGRLAQEKRLDTLLSALVIVRSAFPATVLAMVGEGPMKQSLMTLAKKLGVESSVLWLGSMGIEMLQHEYASATTLVLPSSSEPWGLVVNEALSYGCPAIVSDRCGCVPELIKEGITGFSFAMGNTDELVAKIQIGIRSFSQDSTIAVRCIDHMRNFTPGTAGLQMLIGCRKMLDP